MAKTTKSAKAKKPQVNVRDLKPRKNAKGGGAVKAGWDLQTNKKT